MDRITDMERVKFEICCNSLASAINAEKAGADRIELCANLQNGGTTPSIGMIEMCSKRTQIAINVLIRPRGGDFLYTDDEFEEIKTDIRKCKEYRVNGIVCGILTKDGEIDIERTRELVELSRPLEFTFHRAFDLSKDHIRSLRDVISTGADRILTSGMRRTAYEGKEILADLVRAAKDSIIIMPGSGINESNIRELYKEIGAKEYHFSASKRVDSQMEFRRENVLSSVEDDFTITYSDLDKIINTKKQIQNL